MTPSVIGDGVKLLHDAESFPQARSGQIAVISEVSDEHNTSRRRQLKSCEIQQFHSR